MLFFLFGCLGCSGRPGGKTLENFFLKIFDKTKIGEIETFLISIHGRDTEHKNNEKYLGQEFRLKGSDFGGREAAG